VAIARNASGLPLTITQGGRTRALRYNPDHRLIEVRQNGQLLARYGHNTHGQRISKLVGPQTPASQAQTFLWSQGQLSAEGHGQAIDRRYVYAHGVPVAVIDHPGGASAITPAESPWSALLQWVQTVWRVAATPAPQLTYLHSNEIGTPVAATGARGQLLWQAEHSAFGELRALRTEHRPGHAPQDGVKGFALNLRLPGQYFDAETGWHDNVLRTYAPQRGQYLEPDPLGPTPNWGRGAGPWLTQPFAYANHNPITYADPTGLILFAFDGTGNSNDPEQLASLGNGISNVWQFRQLYADGNRRYISGVGTIDTSDPARPINPKDYVPLAVKLLPVATIVEKDMALNYSGRARITRMEEYFNQEAELFVQNDKAMNVDIVGFSRGAAQAREFANIIANKTNADGYYQYTIKDGAGKVVNKCQKVNFRFMGLWDTVLSTDGVFLAADTIYRCRQSLITWRRQWH
jgi:RHS repeat-associated protein